MHAHRYDMENPSIKGDSGFVICYFLVEAHSAVGNHFHSPCARPNIGTKQVNRFHSDFFFFVSPVSKVSKNG